MAKALGGDAPEVYQRKGSSNLLGMSLVAWGLPSLLRKARRELKPKGRKPGS